MEFTLYDIICLLVILTGIIGVLVVFLMKEEPMEEDSHKCPLCDAPNTLRDVCEDCDKVLQTTRFCEKHGVLYEGAECLKCRMDFGYKS